MSFKEKRLREIVIEAYDRHSMICAGKTVISIMCPCIVDHIYILRLFGRPRRCRISAERSTHAAPRKQLIFDCFYDSFVDYVIHTILRQNIRAFQVQYRSIVHLFIYAPVITRPVDQGQAWEG